MVLRILERISAKRMKVATMARVIGDQYHEFDGALPVPIYCALKSSRNILASVASTRAQVVTLLECDAKHVIFRRVGDVEAQASCCVAEGKAAGEV